MSWTHSTFYLISLAAVAFTNFFVYPGLRCGLTSVVGLSMAVIVHFSARDGHEFEKTGKRFMLCVFFMTAVTNVITSS